MNRRLRARHALPNAEGIAAREFFQGFWQGIFIGAVCGATFAVLLLKGN